MEKNYNVTGTERKALVNKIAEITGQQPVYLGMPSVAFKIGTFEVSRTGKMTWEEGTDETSVEELIGQLKEAGFTAAEDATVEEETTMTPETEDVTEPETATEAEETAEQEPEDLEETDHLSISLPDDLTDEQFTLLSRLVEGKATLLKHAFKSETVEIERADGKLTFPWFTAIDGDHTTAYMLFLTHMIKFVKKASRVTVHDQPVENEKFAFRIFLIRLGMVGTEFKGARKILMENLTGNSAWRDGRPQKGETAAATTSETVNTTEESSMDNSNGEDTQDQVSETGTDTQEAES